ncbi:MAG: PAS domain-containing protein [Nitrospinae bacterium]|nr:PAS domain-containing protein [Nitrospinota bacterium]
MALMRGLHVEGNRQFRVLILDPYGEIPGSLKYILDFLGYGVVRADTLEWALDEMGSHVPNIVFLGFQAGWDGALDALKNQWPETGCFIVTQERQSAAELESAYLGADGFVDAPITFDRLQGLLDRYLIKGGAVSGRKPSAPPAGKGVSPENLFWLNAMTRVEPSSGLLRLSPTGELLWVDEQFCEILGYTKSELFQKNIMDIVHSQSLSEIYSLIQTFSGPNALGEHSATAFLIRKDGAPTQVRLVKTPYFIQVIAA